MFLLRYDIPQGFYWITTFPNGKSLKLHQNKKVVHTLLSSNSNLEALDQWSCVEHEIFVESVHVQLRFQQLSAQ